jgi:hypothetical protein
VDGFKVLTVPLVFAQFVDENDTIVVPTPDIVAEAKQWIEMQELCAIENQIMRGSEVPLSDVEAEAYDSLRTLHDLYNSGMASQAVVLKAFGFP